VQALTPAPVDPDDYGGDLLTDAVLGPLHTEEVDRDLAVYFGRRRPADVLGVESHAKCPRVEQAQCRDTRDYRVRRPPARTK
jgi:hypothetical protein